MPRWLTALALAISVLLASIFAAAQPRTLSAYEKETVHRALERTGHVVDDAPEGKIVESIEIASFEVFEDRDYLPTTFPTKQFNVAGVANSLHAVSRPWVIRREVLLRPGKPFVWSLVKESERNLRVRQISVVLILPVRGSRPDRVRLLVITKDVWSLRVNFEPRFYNGTLDRITVQPSEENLFGLHKTVNATLLVTRNYYSTGIGYIDPRVGGSRLRATGDANVIFNCQSNQPEGSWGSFSYGKPLYSTRTPWSWGAMASWTSRILRPYGNNGARLCNGGGLARLDFAVTPQNDDVPYQYRYDYLQSQLSATRSYGVFWKYNLSFGLETRRVASSLMNTEGLSPLVLSEYRSVVPTTDLRLGPFVELRAYRNRFHRVVNVETLGLQEDYQVGHNVWLRVYPTAQAIGATRNLIGVYNGIEYTVPIADGFARGYAESQIELSTLARSDAAAGAGLRLVSPELSFARLVADGAVRRRYRNYLNPISFLGGTDRLRGYRPSVFGGPDWIVANFELRTAPVHLPGVLVGAVGFWDMGDAFNGMQNFHLKHGFGGGLRVLLPQLDRAVFRVDVGFPLDPSVPGAQSTIIAQFRQAFDVPDVDPPGLYWQDHARR